MSEPMWTLPMAFELMKQLQPKANAYGYCLTIGGGVLNRGQSHKDLDIVCFHDTRHIHSGDPTAMLMAMIREFSLVGAKRWDTKAHVVIAFDFAHGDYAGKRIEFWFPYHRPIEGSPLEMYRPFDLPQQGGPCAQDLDNAFKRRLGWPIQNDNSQA